MYMWFQKVHMAVHETIAILHLEQLLCLAAVVQDLVLCFIESQCVHELRSSAHCLISTIVHNSTYKLL